MPPSPQNRRVAAVELALWQAQADSIDSSDLYVWLRDCGLPPEIAIRLKEVAGITRRIGGRLVSIGKIILIKLIEFAQAHPKMVIGIAVGAALASLITTVPFLGPVLAPVTIPLGIAGGAIAGYRLDAAGASGLVSGPNGFIELTQNAIEIGRLFFQLFVDTLHALAEEFQQEVV